jgi:excinuclease UvrABC helicase subunit UvrB
MEENNYNKDKVYNNLIVLLKMFKNKPYQLAKYLMQNDAFDDVFIEKLIHSKKLNEMDEKLRQQKNPFFEEPKHFNNFHDMRKSQSEILRPETKLLENKDLKKLEEDLNKQLQSAEEKEDYEKAVSIRDYMLMLKMTPQPKK